MKHAGFALPNGWSARTPSHASSDVAVDDKDVEVMAIAMARAARGDHNPAYWHNPTYWRNLARAGLQAVLDGSNE
jgi:hypothetical protein